MLAFQNELMITAFSKTQCASCGLLLATSSCVRRTGRRSGLERKPACSPGNRRCTTAQRKPPHSGNPERTIQPGSVWRQAPPELRPSGRGWKYSPDRKPGPEVS